MKISTTFRKLLRHPGMKLWAVLVWLALWQLLYEVTDVNRRDLLLSSPVQVAEKLWMMMGTRDYWSRVLFSSLHIMAGMLLGACAGTLLGACAFFIGFMKVLLRPLVSVIRSVPVVTFIIIAVYWVGYRDLSMFIAFLICFPVFYSNTQVGLGAADEKLIEMAKVYRLGFFRRLASIYLPSLVPHLLAAGEVAVGLAWKSGIAAEYIAAVTSVQSIGGGVYNAKTNWLTVDTLAWTVTIVCLSAIFGAAVRALLRLASRKWGNGA